MASSLKKPINYRVIILCSLLALIVTFIALASTVWTIQNVEINPLIELQTLDEQSLATSISEQNLIPTGQSVFLLNKRKVNADIEKAFPYIKVVNLEIEFPNVAKLNFIERKNQFYVNLTNSIGNYAIVDREFKVLQTTSTTPTTEIELKTTEFNNVSAGEFLSVEHSALLSDYTKAFEMNSLSESALITLITSMEVKTRASGELEVEFKTKSTATITCIGTGKIEYKIAELKQIISSLNAGESCDIFEQNGQIVHGSGI